MKKNWVLTQDAFDTLLGWLDADRDRAGARYEEIRTRLIKVFTCRGCFEAEELADETINRVVGRVVEIAPVYEGDPVLYFYRVSQNVLLEHRRKKLRQAEIPVEMAAAANFTALPDDCEPEYQCLERCLEQLPTDNRKLVLEYYQQERRAKIDHRKQLADAMGVAVNALRIRAYRIRRALEECVRACLEQQPAN